MNYLRRLFLVGVGAAGLCGMLVGTAAAQQEPCIVQCTTADGQPVGSRYVQNMTPAVAQGGGCTAFAQQIIAERCAGGNADVRFLTYRSAVRNGVATRR